MVGGTHRTKWKFGEGAHTAIWAWVFFKSWNQHFELHNTNMKVWRGDPHGHLRLGTVQKQKQNQSQECAHEETHGHLSLRIDHGWGSHNTEMKVWRGDARGHLRLTIDQKQQWELGVMSALGRTRNLIEQQYHQLRHAHAPSGTDNCLFVSSPGLSIAMPWCKPPEEICAHQW